MLVQRDNPGRDALILAGPALSGTKHSMTNTPPGSSAPRDIAEAVDPASLAEHGELKTRYTSRNGPTTGICAMSGRGRHGQAK